MTPTAWNSTALISRAEIERHVDLDTADEVVEAVLRGQVAGRVAMPAKVTMNLAEFGLDGWHTAMPAYVESMRASGLKWVGGFAANPGRFGLPFLMSLILVQDADSGAPLALMDGVHILNLRTAALNGLIVRLYARPDSRRLAIVGAGAQARHGAAAIARVIDLEEIRVYDIDPAATERFETEVGRSIGVAVTVCDDAEAAVRGADIVMTATTSTAPIVRSAWLAPGVTAISVGSQGQEFEDDVIFGADKLICDSWEQCTHLGELRALAESGRLTRSDVYAEIGETLVGSRAGRERPAETILVVPIGLGSLDVAMARVAYERVTAAGPTATFRFFEPNES